MFETGKLFREGVEWPAKPEVTPAEMKTRGIVIKHPDIFSRFQQIHEHSADVNSFKKEIFL